MPYVMLKNYTVVCSNNVLLIFLTQQTSDKIHRARDYGIENYGFDV